MKILVTGGTGLVGSACIKHLLSQGHTIRALARSPASADKISALGATPVQGDISDSSLLTAEARVADAVLYVAYDHVSPDRMTTGPPTESAALEAICKGLEGSNKLLIYASGVGLFGPNDGADEFTPLKPWFRSAADQVAATYATRGVRPIQLRLAMIVHDHTSPHNFIRTLVQGEHVTFAKDGANRWPAVHTDDVAVLVGQVLAREDQIPAGKVSAVHAYSEQITTKDLAEAIAKQTGLPIEPMTDEAVKKKGPLLEYVMTASPGISNKWTREAFGWEPKRNTVLQDMKVGRWFL